jgi:glycosyltransferase involved in cell wall biosynthesis
LEPCRRAHGRFTIGYAGRLVNEKGIDILVAAIRRLGSEVELLIVGDGPLYPWLESANLGRASLRLIRDAEHSEMSRFYAEMDVLVLPSRTTAKWAEQFGRVLVEAMHCGTPVIGSSSGEIPWVISVTGGGVIFPEGDVEALAEQLERLRIDQERREALAERGKERAGQLFSVEAVANRMEEVLLDPPRARRRMNLRSKPRVVLVAHGVHDRGGMERACAELIRHAEKEIDFYVVSAELDPELRSFVKEWIRIGVPKRPIPVKFIVFWLRAGWALRRVDGDLVHTIGAVVPNRVDIASIHHCHIGYVMGQHRLAPTSAPIARRLNTTISRSLGLLAERWTFRPHRLRAFAAVSEGLAQEVNRYYPGIKCVVTPNGVDLTRFHPDSHIRRALRETHGTTEDTIVTLFVGSDWNHKGLKIAIDAVASARACGEDIELWIVGQGDRARFEHISAHEGVQGHVRFFGPRDDAEQFYQAADAFLLPSIYEGFSLACLEAAASGLPLLIPPISGAQEVVGENEGGYIVPRCVASFTRALVRLAADSELRSRLGSAAHDKVQVYTWKRSADSVMNLYKELLA